MRYTSEYIEKILTSPAAKKGIHYITPIYQDAYVALWLMQAIGTQTDLIVQWIEEYKEQILPQTATWLLPYWEEEYGIPTNPDLDIETRRNRILYSIKDRAPMNPKKLETLLNLAGNINDAVIVENTDKNTFSVVMEEALDKSRLKKIYKALDEHKPAHLIYFITVLTKSAVDNENSVSINRLKISASVWNMDIKRILLNGQKNLDGTWCLMALTKSPKLNQLTVNTGITNGFGVSSKLKSNNIWRLNGTYFLDGTKRLSAEMKEEIL